MSEDSTTASKPAQARGPGPRRHWWAVLAVVAVGAGTAAWGQSSPFDPLSSPLQSGANQTQPAGAAGQYGQSPSGASQTVGPAAAAPGYSPVVIQTPAGQTSQETPTNRVTAPAEGATAQPVYLKPSTTPGQFEVVARPPTPPSDFEAYVRQVLGRSLPRFGSSLVLPGGGFTTGPTTTVPPDYALNPGDELIIGVTGSVEADIRLVIDSEGRIFVPKIGSINVAGIRYGDLASQLTRRFSQQFKDVRVSVAIGHLHGLNVYVTGYAAKPGAYQVSSLSTLVNAVLAAGGPSPYGSFRSIQLRRGGRLVSDLDLYDLLLSGDKSHDAVLQNEDVVYIGPAGPEVAITGAVNSEAIYETKPGETLGDIIRYAGGLNSLADETRVLVTRLADLDTTGSRQLDFATAKAFPAERGDIVRILSLANVARPLERQAILATIEGEVDHAGRYYLRPGSTLADLMATAGGMTGGAYVFGTEVDRVTVREQQQASFDKAISNLELAAAALPLSSSTAFLPQATSPAARSQAALAIIERLKERKPDGRLVLDLGPEATALPGDLRLENNDRIIIPPRPTTVGVFGAVYQTGSFLFRPRSRLADYLKLAGGPQKMADKGEIFVVRANGSVLSSRQVSDFGGRPALPGDVIFVPVRTTLTAWDKLLQVAALVYQFGVGALTLKALGL